MSLQIDPDDIVAELRKGSSDALRVIHSLYYPALRNFAGNLAGDFPAAEDILTEIFVTLWRKHKDFGTLTNIKAFLYISTRNACINHVRKLQREALRKDGLSNYLSPDCEGYVLNEMIRAELLQQIYEAIDALPSQCRRVVKMCYVEGLSNAQIALETRISVNTVKNHKARALSLLRLKFLDDPAMAILSLCVVVAIF
jgi:RNA polymerase sigma-19 factor, ECF subfamily